MKKFFIPALALVLLVSAAANADELKPWNPPDYFAPVNYAQIGGMRIAYLEAGCENPKTILFIHGFTGDAQNWWDQYEYFKQNYHVVVIDNPGHGKSERRKDLAYTMAMDGQAAVGLLDHLEVEKAIIVGNSMGGQIAGWIAINHPDRVEKLVLCDAAGSNDFRYLIGLKPLITPELLSLILKPTSGQQYPDDLPRAAERRLHPQSLAGTTEEPLYLDALAKSIKSLALEPIRDDLHRIQAPTLLIWGDDDKLVNPKSMDDFAARIPDTTRYLVLKGGHTPQMQTPTEFNCAVEAFIEDRDTGACRAD